MERPASHPFRSEKAKEAYLAHYDRRAAAWPVVSRPALVDTAYGQTFVRVSGPAGAPPLVLLPGLAVNSLMWAPNIQALSGEYRTYAVDNIYDCGRSVYSRPLRGPADFVHWLDGLFDALGMVDGIHLVGMSFGGWAAGQYALRAPKRLAKLVLLAPAATVLPLRLEFVLRILLGFVSRPSLLHWLFDDARRDEAGRRLVEAMAEDMALASRCFKRRSRVFPTVLTDEALSGLGVPTLYLVGENEKIYDAHKAVQRLNRVAPRIRTGIVSRAGHDFTFLQPEQVSANVLEFLKQP